LHLKAERARKQCELEASDTREQLNDQNGQNQVLSGLKRKLEGEINALHVSVAFVTSLRRNSS